MKYEVVLPGRPPGNISSTARAMAEAFSMSEAKAEALLRSAPGPLTKPVGEREAVRVAYRLRRLGLSVDVRPVEGAPPAAIVGTAGSLRGGSAGGSGRDAERSSAPSPERRAGPRPGRAGDHDFDRQAAAARVPEREPHRPPEPERELHRPPERHLDREPARGSTAALVSEPVSPVERSPFLSQVDEAPRFAPSADEWEREWEREGSPNRTWDEDEIAEPTAGATPTFQPAVADPASHTATQPSTTPPSTPLPAPYRGADASAASATGAADRRARPRLPFARRLILAALLPGAIALLGAGLVFAAIGAGTADSTLEGIAVSSAGALGPVLAGRDPAGIAAQAAVRDALSGPQQVLRTRGVELVLVAAPNGAVLAGWEDGGTASDADLAQATTGLGALLVRAQREVGPVLGEIGGAGERRRAAAAAVRVRGEPVAAVIVGAAAGFPVGRFPASMLAGFLLLALGTLAVWSANRSLLRENERLLEETMRISRGDLSRPVYASDRFPDTVQALERIRVSLQEGLERLRRRKK